MVRIDLSRLNAFAGIVFPAPTGIVWTNQAGGERCTHPEMEGVFVPFDVGDENAWGGLENLWGEWDAWSPERVAKWLAAHGLYDFLAVPPGRQARPALWGEAWVPVIVKSRGSLPAQLRPFVGKVGWFTWPNSD
jgi:hypothetical protein